MNNLKMKKRRGFTLIELVIVVAIVAILALMIIPQFTDLTSKASKATVESNYQTLVSAYTMYQADHNGAPPATKADLEDYLAGSFPENGSPIGAMYEFIPAPASGTNPPGFAVVFDADGNQSVTVSFNSSASNTDICLIYPKNADASSFSGWNATTAGY